MCGIVGIACNGPATLQMKELFQTMLYMDVVRGEHATGIAAIDTVNKKIDIAKKAMSSPFFLNEASTQELFAYKENYNIYIGHNRYATSGSKDKDEFAHPFHHGNIVGVHNGSLRDQTLLDDHKDFEVDSENIFYHMNLHGLDDTLSKLNGAFSLVWYNSEDNSLNFIRNEDRPMCVARLTGGAYVWASEMSMLKWLIKRHKVLRFEKIASDKDEKVQEDFCYNLAPGRHYKIPFVGRQAREATLVQKTLPTFPVQAWGKYSTDYTDYSQGNRRNNSSSSNVRVIESPVLSKVVNRVKEGTYLEVKLSAIIQEKIYNSATSSHNFRNRYLFTHSLYPGDKCKLLKLYNLGFDTFVESLTNEDLGKMFYGRVTSAYSASSYTPEGVANITENGEGIVVSISDLSSERPKNFLSFCKLTSIPADQMQTKPPTKPRLRLKAGVQTEEGKRQPTVFESSKLSGLVQLANCRLDKLAMMEVTAEHHYHCSNCAKSISSTHIANLYVITEKEKGGDHAHYIMCSHDCYKEMKAFCAEAESMVMEGYVE